MRTVSTEELRLWRQVVRDATPLPDRALPPEKPEPPAATPAPPPVARPAAPLPPVSPRLPPAPLNHGETPGLDRRSATRMRRGRLAIEDSIDLHGFTQEQAHVALDRFLTRAHAAGLRCVLVVTGKGLRDGTGVLRATVPRWLNEPGLRRLVLGFSYAQPKDGGEGALYVLLKRQRPG